MFKLPYNGRLSEVLGEASRWANRMGASHLGTEHALLGLAEVDGVAKNALADMGVTVESLRKALPEPQKKLLAPTDEEALRDLGIDVQGLRNRLSEQFGTHLSVSPGLAWTTALTVAVWLSEQQAERLGAGEVTPEHLLLALIWQADTWVMGLVGSFVSARELRRGLLEHMDVPDRTLSRYIRECERSERISADRASVSPKSAKRISESVTDQQIVRLLKEGGNIAISRSLLKRVIGTVNASGFSVVDGANRASPAFWVEVSQRLRQIFVATAIPAPGGEVASVGVTNPGLVPAWVDVRSWPSSPVHRREPSTTATVLRPHGKGSQG